jgi:hypothetical protein
LKNIVLEVHSTLQQMSEEHLKDRIEKISRITASD